MTGRVQLVERPVTPDEVGKSISNLSSGGRGLRIYRDGNPLGFWEAECETLREGDVVVEIVQTRNGG